MTVQTAINIEEILGHMVKAELNLNGMFGKVLSKEEGRIIYSLSNQSLFFLPKGNRNRGYIIHDESDILSVELIRKDNKKHNEYIEQYRNREELEEQYLQQRREQYEQQEKLRKERFERERQKKKEAEEREIEEAKALGGYDELEKEVFSFYESFGDFYNESFVKTVTVPLLNKLINKSISDVNGYPKHYFDKKHNTRMCKLIEDKLDIKLVNTQKGNVEKLNEYLSN